eukprot:s413_g12.t1
MLRAAVDLDSAATIVSLDGRSAYATISRPAFLRKLHAVAPALVPFALVVRAAVHILRRRRTIHQGEGCEQGDALAPALYALGQHDALAAADEQLRSGECWAAFLDDAGPAIAAARNERPVACGDERATRIVIASIGEVPVFGHTAWCREERKRTWRVRAGSLTTDCGDSGSVPANHAYVYVRKEMEERRVCGPQDLRTALAVAVTDTAKCN